MDDAWFRTLAKQAQAMDPWPDPRFPPSPYYRFFMLLANKLKPRLSVELGVDGCGGTLHLALGYPEGIVVGVDIINMDEPGHPMHERYRYVMDTCPNARFLTRCDSIVATDIITKEYPGLLVDILFIDTTHVYEQTMNEFYAWQPLLSDRAVVCLDDIFRPGMSQAWSDLPGDKVRLDDLHTGAIRKMGGGFGVLWF